jgi:uroporphyrinogen-III decarboxylase
VSDQIGETKIREEIASHYPHLYDEFISSPQEILAHNRQAQDVWDAYRRDEPIRVPATWPCMNPMRLMYAEESIRFRDYWHVAAQMLDIQGTASLLNRLIITTDDIKQTDQPIQASLDFHPFCDEAYWGCPIEFYDRDQPRVRHVYDAEKVPPEEIPIPDPVTDGFMKTISKMYEEMTQLVQSGTSVGGVGFKPTIGAYGMKATYGIFNSALQMRGTNLFMDLLDDPEYVHKLLDVTARGYVRRVKAWEQKTGDKNTSYAICYDHGIDMMSIADYERFLVPIYKRVKRELGAARYDEHIEHCGRGEEVIRYKHEHFGVNSFTNLNASCLDLEKLRHDLGPEVFMQVTIHPGLVHTGPVDNIRQAVKDVLTPRLMGKGRLTFGIQGDNFKAPLEHIRALYEAVVEYGRY